MKRRYFFLISFLSFLLLALLFFSGYLGQVQRTLIDNVYGSHAVLDEVVIVAIDDASLQEIGRWPWDRTVMASLVRNLADARVVAFDVGFFEPTGDDAVLADAIERAGNVVLAMEYTSFDRSSDGVTGTAQLVPVSPLDESALALGYVNIITDGDGVTRSLNTNIQGQFQSFANEVVEKGFGQPIETSDRLMINFAGGPGSFEYVSAKDVLSGAALLGGRVVLVGATSPDLRDTFFVPTSKGVPMPGVEVLANAAQTIVQDRALAEQSTPALLMTMLLFAMLVAAAFTWLNLRWVVVVVPLAGFVYVFSAIIAYEYNVLLNVVYGPLALAVPYAGNLTYAYVARKRQRDEAVTAFSKYVSEDVVRELLNDPKKLALGGEHRTITVFFSDIRGFTSVSERLSAVELVDLLNEYLTHMTDIIIEERGTVDKYMGDAIMAFWGAPLEQPDHAVRACRTSLRMIERLKQLQQDWSARGIPVLDIGIGLNTGDAVVGNMGSAKRFDYTAMGDTVNLGSRLEGVNKPYGTRIIISESTQRLVKQQFITRLLDRIKVKGRDGGIEMYELVGEVKTLDEKTKSAMSLFESAMQLYFDQQWDRAIEKFRQVLHEVPDDAPSKLFISRCDEFRKNPPGPSWDGVWIMTTK